mgnify:CR=1 FL=1
MAWAKPQTRVAKPPPKPHITSVHAETQQPELHSLASKQVPSASTTSTNCAGAGSFRDFQLSTLTPYFHPHLPMFSVPRLTTFLLQS